MRSINADDFVGWFHVRKDGVIFLLSLADRIITCLYNSPFIVLFSVVGQRRRARIA